MIHYRALLASAAIAITCAGTAFAEEAKTTGTATGAAATSETASASKTVTLPGGTKYVDEKVGTGAEAAAGKTVSVHYKGTFENGTEFDNSYKRGQPIEFPLGTGSVIAGWDKGIAGMKIGGKRKLTIPYNEAYGENGRPGIPPKSTLIFETELMGVK